MVDELLKYKNRAIQLSGEYSTGRVWLFGEELFPGKSQRLRNHSADGFAWGYGGSGPSLLALAICLKLFDTEIALAVYQDFKWKYISVLHQSDFEIDFTLEYFKPGVKI